MTETRGEQTLMGTGPRTHTRGQVATDHCETAALTKHNTVKRNTARPVYACNPKHFQTYFLIYPSILLQRQQGEEKVHQE